MTYNPITGMGCAQDDDCDGGYRQVSERYVDEVAPVTAPPYPHLEQPPDDAPAPILTEYARRLAINERHRRLQESKRASAAASSFPCPNCNPEQFLRWQQGAWPYPRRDGAVPVANAPVEDDGLFSDLAAGYEGPDF